MQIAAIGRATAGSCSRSCVSAASWSRERPVRLMGSLSSTSADSTTSAAASISVVCPIARSRSSFSRTSRLIRRRGPRSVPAEFIYHTDPSPVREVVRVISIYHFVSDFFVSMSIFTVSLTFLYLYERIFFVALHFRTHTCGSIFMQHAVTGAMKKGKVRPFTVDDLPVLEKNGYTLRVKSSAIENNDFEVEVGPPSNSAFQVGTVRTYVFHEGAQPVYDPRRRYGYAELKFDLATSHATLELR